MTASLILDGNIKMYLVSGSSGHNYFVTRNGQEYLCTCPDYLFRKKECKHIKQVKGEMSV